jgi:predicted Zn-dependent peptidase
VSTIHHHRFDNGLVLIAEPMPRVQSAAFSLLVPAGAAHEPPDRNGAAAMLAEWILRGAGERDSRQIVDDLDQLGVSHSLGAQTLHTALSGATLGRNLLPALSIFADVLRDPHLDPDELEPIRALALQSLASLEDDPASHVLQQLRRRHYPDPFGRPASGSRDGLLAASEDDLNCHFQANFRPNGAILGVAGAIDWDELRDSVAQLLGDWEPRPDPPLHETPTGPARGHISKETNQTQIALAFPTVNVASPFYYHARALTAILGGYASARLFTEVREKRGLCYSVFAGYEAQPARAAVTCYAGTSSERAQQTLDVTWAEIDRLARDGIHAEELDMMRAGLKTSLIMQQESSLGRAGALASDWFHLGRVRSLEEIASALDALTPAAVSDFAHQTRHAESTILTLGPTPLEFPA